MLDYLDFMKGKFNKTFAGKYFKDLPEPENDVCHKPITYEIVQPGEKTYRQLISNLNDTRAVYQVIKTSLNYGFEPGEYILTAEGILSQIASVRDDFSAASSEAARLSVIPPGREFILALIQIDNPWGIC